MALMSDYIQWYLDSDELEESSKPFAQYAKVKQRLMGEASFQFYKRKLEQEFKSSDDMQKFLTLSSAIVQNKNFEQALSNAVDNLKMPDLSNMQVGYVAYYKNLLKTNSEEFTKLTTQISNALMAIISILGISNFEALPPDNKMGKTNAELKKALQLIYKDNPSELDRIIKLSEFKELDNKYKGQYGYLLSLIPDFTEIASAGGTATDASLKILSKILTPIQTLIGICNEYQVEIEVNKLVDDFAKSLNQKSVQATRTGDIGSADGFSIGTADLAIHMNPGASNIQFSIPDIGVSLKRTGKNLKTAKDVNIKLKGTNIGNLMHELDPELVTQFYTLYANAAGGSGTQPNLGGVQQRPVPAATMQAAYKYMKSLALVPALVGNFDVDELVSIFVINNKSYTIYDLLAQIAESSDEDVGVIFSKELSSHRKDIQAKHSNIYDLTDYEHRNSRSQKIRQYIDAISVAVHIRLSNSFLNRVAK